MADDPINIQVTDNVDPGIANKIQAIGAAATASNANLVELRAQLAAINGNNLATLQAQAQTVTQSINAELNATTSLRQATDLLVTAAMSLTKAEIATAQNADSATASIKRQTAATNDLVAANGKVKTSGMIGPINVASPTSGAASAYAGMTDAQAQEAYAAALAKTAAAQAAVGGGAAKLAAEVEAGTAATVKAAESVGTTGVSFFTKFKTGVANSFDGLRDLITNNGTAFKAIAPAAEEAGAAIEKVGGHSINTASALREVLVGAREIGRGDFTRLAGSASILASALGLLPVALTAAAVGFGLLYSERSKLNTDAEQKSEVAYAESLGLSEKEMRKLTNTTVDANGVMKEHNVLQITMGDTLNGFVKTVEEGLSGLTEKYAENAAEIKSVFAAVLGAVATVFEGFYGLVKGLIVLLEGTALNIVTLVSNAALVIANTVILTVQGVVNTVVKLLNAVADGANAVSHAAGFNDVVGKLGEWDSGIKSVTQNTKGLVSVDVAGAVKKGVTEASATLKGFSAEWDNNTKAANRARIAGLAAAEIANRNPKNPKKDSDADPKTQDDYLYEENTKLDNQLKLFGMLKEARDVQTQLDAIEEAGIKRRLPFSAAELQGFKDKIVQIQANNRVMAEMDSIYTALRGPQEKFQDDQTALLELFLRHNITLTEYNQKLDALTRSYQEATDPLFKINEDLTNQAKTYGVVGDALDNLNNSEKVRLAFLAKDIDLTKNATAAQLAAAKAAVTELNANDKQKYTDDTVKSVVDPILQNKKLLANKKSYYDELDQMAKDNMLTENQYTQAKYALDAKLTQAKLQGTSDALDEIATLSSSKNKELAAIGKAAAVANATIKGIEAVQNALASVPPPFNFVLAGIVGVAAAANVAKIINTPTDTGSYQTGGDFVVSGKTGVDTNRIAMNVSNGERVTIQTVAQQQAARTGQNNAPGGDTHVANYFDEASFVAAMDTKRGERVIMNVIGRNPKAIKSVLGGGKG